MRTRYRLTAVGVAGLVLTWVASPGVATATHGNVHGIGWTDQDDGTIEVGAEGGTDGQASEVGGAASQSVCEWERVPEDSITSQRWASTADDFVLYFVDCPDRPRDIVEVPTVEDGSGGSVVGVRERAVELLVLPEPHIEVNPSDPVVHVETWLWVDGIAWETRSQTASAAGVTATVRAVPERVVWDMGNGDQVVCDGLGTPYDPSRPSEEQSTDCSYTYRHTSADQPGETFEVTATVQWSLRWAVVGAAGGGTLPATSTSGTALVRVGEMQALNR